MPILVTPLISRALVVGLFADLLLRTVLLLGRHPEKKVALTDFELFHMIGRMVWRGELLDAYQITSLLRAERTLTGVVDFMPWTYPPPFDLVAALLACGPLALSYLLFVGITLGAFLLILRRIAGPCFPLVLLTIYPALLMTIACGQNGFLTASLIGLATLALRRNRAVAGVPLGLMIIKPHLAVAFAVHALVSGRWRTVAVAVAAAGMAAAIAGLLLGFAAWGAALAATREARVFLAAGYYPLHRMVSVYAALRSFGSPAWAAFLGQGLVSGGAMAMLLTVSRRAMPTEQLLGLTCLATLFVSPYAYDYDLPIYGIALGFLKPDLLRLGRRGELIALLTLSAAAGACGWFATFWIQITNPAMLERGITPGVDALPPSLAGFIMLACTAIVVVVLRRGRNRAAVTEATGQSLPVTALSLRNASAPVGL